MTKEEHDLLLITALIVLARHNDGGSGADRERAALRKALAPFKAEIETALSLSRPHGGRE